jgi:hypothetical protein
MDLKSALEYLVALGRTEILEIQGQKYSTKDIHHVKYPSPAALGITTLSGLVDYIKSGIDLDAKVYEPNEGDCDKGEADDLLIQVISPTKVKLLSPILSDESRDCYIECAALTPDITFNRFIDIENFNIMVQSCFEPAGDVAAVLEVAANIKEEEVKESIDDGVTQEVTIKAGIQRLKSVVVPNPVMLRPFRTFLEVEQPESKFVFRMKNGPQAALYEADGGAWRSEAMKNIKEYLEKELQGYSTKVIS